MINYIRQLNNGMGVYRNLAPVFGYLLLMILGFLLGDIIELSDGARYALYSISFACLILSFQFEKKFFKYGFFFCFSLLYYDYRVDSSTPSLPETELSLEIKVGGVNTVNDRYVSGYASILDAYDFDADLKDRELFFVIYGKEQAIDAGSVLRVRGVLRPVEEGLGGFESFLARRKISYKLVSGEGRVEHLPLGSFDDTLQGIRGYIASNIENSSEEYRRYLPLYRALMIGDMSRVDKADKQKFARSASIHIFAISGLHVGLVASLLLLIFRGVNIPYVGSILLSLVILYIYVQVCGAKPSAMRAYMMLFFVALAYLCRRKANTFNALLLSGSIALLFDPKNLYNVGFLLSYCVVGSIVLYGVSLNDYLLSKYKPYAMLPRKLLTLPQRSIRGIYSYLLMSFSISFSAFLGGGFLCSYFFGYVAWASILNFIIFIPMVFLILILGFTSLCMPSFVARLINDFILVLLEFMANVAKFFSDSKFIIEIKIESVYILICALFVFFAVLIYLRDKRDLRLIYVPVSILACFLGLGYVLKGLDVVG